MLVVLLALLLFPNELVLWQFFKQFRLSEVSHQVGINLRHDGREGDEIGINRPRRSSSADGSLKKLLGEIGIA